MTGYRYDVFVSYKRHKEWTPWTREHIRTQLDAYLTQDLGREPRIFIDDQIELGADWPNRLGNALGQSCVLVPIFSGDYFGSDWCLHELDLMHGRMQHYSGSELIVPVIVHDGDRIPDEIGRLWPTKLSKFRITDLPRYTEYYRLFSEEIKELSRRIAAAMRTAPPCDATWQTECQTRFDQIYTAHCASHSARVPVKTLTLKPDPFPLTAPPRVTI